MISLNNNNKTSPLNSNAIKKSLFYHCPIGLIILEKAQNENNIEFQLKFVNSFASNLLELPQGCNVETIKEKCKGFKRWETNKITEITLSSQIFDDISNYKTLNGTYIGEYSMIYVKVKNINTNIFICVDNYTEERKSIQLNLMKSLQYQYLLTLYHEINNPMNALINLVEEDIELEDNNNNNNNYNFNNNLNFDDNSYTKEYNTLFKKGWIVLLVKLIKFFIKNFIWYVKIVFELDRNRNTHRQPQTNDNNDKYINDDKIKNININPSLIELDVHLNIGYIFKSINKKYDLLFQYKDVITKVDFSILENKFTISNEKYFKNFLNALYMYLYNVVPKKNGFELEIVEFPKTKILSNSTLQEFVNASHFQSVLNTNKNILMITYKKLEQHNKQKHKNPFHIDDIDFGYKKDYKASKTVQTIEFMRDLIMNFAHLLKINLQLSSYGDDTTNIYFSFLIPYETLKEEFDLGNVDEFTPRKSQNILLNNAVNRQMIVYNSINQTTSANSPRTNGNGLNGNFCYSVSDDNISDNRNNNTCFGRTISKMSSRKGTRHTHNKDLLEMSLLDQEKPSFTQMPDNNNNFQKRMQNEFGFYGDIDSPLFKDNKLRFTIGAEAMDNSISIGHSPEHFSADHELFEQHNNSNILKFYTRDTVQFDNNDNPSPKVPTPSNNNYYSKKKSNITRPNVVINILETSSSICKQEDGDNGINQSRTFSTYSKTKPPFKRLHSKQQETKRTKLPNENEILTTKQRLNLSACNHTEKPLYKNTNSPSNEIYEDYQHNHGSKTSFTSALLQPVKINNNLLQINNGNIIHSQKTQKNINIDNNNSNYIHIRSTFHISHKQSLKTSKILPHSNQTFNPSSHDNNYISSFSYANAYDHLTKQQDDNKTHNFKETFGTMNGKEILRLPPQTCSCATVLLCDDEEFNLSTINMCFKRQNILTDRCTNGKECIEQIKHKTQHPCIKCKCNEYKVLLLDIMMPVMDGVEASKQIQQMMDKGEISKELQIIIISAHIDEELKARLQGISCIKEYVVKPVKNDKIKQIIQQYCFGVMFQDNMSSNLTLENA